MKACRGEVLGTFILVFVGLSTVVHAAILETISGGLLIGGIWGAGLFLAISLTGPMSGAHLNPAITLAFASTTDFCWRKVTPYIIAQIIGAFIAAGVVYLMYGSGISSYEEAHGLMRGSEESVRSAMVFGEFYPNPAVAEPAFLKDGLHWAFLAEGVGTAILALVIFIVIRVKRLPTWAAAALISLTLTLLIFWLAPYSQAGFNPARDLMPRIFSSLAGWKGAVFTYNGMGWLLVYVIAPIIGAQIGAYLGKLIGEKS